MGAKPAEHEVELTKAALTLVAQFPKIFFLSQIFGIMGITKHMFYKHIYKGENIDEINILLRRNRSIGAIIAMDRLEKCGSAAAIITEIKITSPEARHIIRDESDSNHESDRKILTREQKIEEIKKTKKLLEVNTDEDDEDD